MLGTRNDLTQLFHWNGIHSDRGGQADCMGQKSFLKWIMDIYDDTVPQCDGDRSRLNVNLMVCQRGLEWHHFLMARPWGRELISQHVQRGGRIDARRSRRVRDEALLALRRPIWP